MTVAPNPPGPRHRLRPGSAPTLVTVLLGFLTLPMLMSGTTVALPAIGRDLHASGAALQWVVVGYFLAASSMMLVAGSLGDLYGRRRVFACGAAGYTAGALGSAVAADVLLLDAARTLAGVGAAGVMAAGGALLGATFKGPARTRAFAAMGTTAGFGMAVGPSLSGWLVGSLGWRVAFAGFAAVGALIWLGSRFMAESRAEVRPRLDVPGSITLVAALAAVMFGVNQAAGTGWDSPAVLAPAGVGLVLLGVFAAVERRRATPVLDLALLRERRFMAWCIAGCAVAAGPAGVVAFLPTWLQGVTGASEQVAGLTMLALTGPVLLLPQVGAWSVERGLAPRTLITISLLLVAAGNAWLTVLHPGITAMGLLGPLATIGIGMGLAIGTVDGQAVGQVDPARLGMASGLLNTVRAGGATLVTALFGTALVTQMQARTGDVALAARVAAGELVGPDRIEQAVLFTGAWRTALAGVAAGGLGTAVLVRLLLAEPDSSRSTRHTRRM